MVMWGAHGHPISTHDICRWCKPGRTGCPLLALSGHRLLHCTCLLLTQSGHWGRKVLAF
jgi:hypothetical protein